MKNALRRSLYRLHFVVGSLTGVVSFLGVSLAGMVYVLLLQGRSKNAPFLFARGFGAVMKAILGWKIALSGTESLASMAPALFVANHQSNLDVVTYGSIFPPRTVAVGKKELLRIPLFGWFFKASGNVLLDRQNREKAVQSMVAAAERIRNEGISVWMFPEGHRNQKRELLPFKKGPFHLAIAGQLPVVIVVSEPIAGLLDAKRGLVRPGTLRIRVLPPIPVAGFDAGDVDVLMARVHAAMQEARDELSATAGEPID